ncbi:putative RNA-directed DNA polymerase from transposon X-element [Portunus trituberculatus]|uniref:Putative RNA-directed DNA polymerase from transposon X-element n=1 Tax=Portunus trituberculatus TaxID=210409 RepID=A0A5B7GP54_PORTR|nr:putative RNA-directed DNA polymerase from transposon X-element [Portunus trituberculatus]
MSSFKILRNDIFHALAGLNPRKAYGPCLAKLFQLCLSTSTFPSCWKFAYIQIVHKKGDRSNPSNYCPIDFIPCMSKVFFYLSSLGRFLNICHFTILYLISSIASGKVALLLTWCSLLSLCHPLLETGVTFAVALDISKAFDRVWRKGLISNYSPTTSILLSAILF